jgi:phosphoribosylformylglycinamidine cyclo-ligase (EC 6.3.3.1)
MTDDVDDELTYADAGVDIEASESATAALIDAVGDRRAITPACWISATAISP